MELFRIVGFDFILEYLKRPAQSDDDYAEQQDITHHRNDERYTNKLIMFYCIFDQ